MQKIYYPEGRKVIEMSDKFEMTYPDETHDEVKRLREKYTAETVAKKNDKFAELKKLDESVGKKACTVSLCVGVLFCMVFGAGMALCMSYQQYVIGIIIGVIGAAGMAVAYPIYKAVYKKQKAKVSERILKLSDELLGK